MKCKHLKLIMELIFIFILPLAFLLPCVSVQNEFVYDDSGNYESSNKVLSFDNPFNYVKDNEYINYFDFNQINDRSISSSYWLNFGINITYDSNTCHLVATGTATGNTNSSLSNDFNLILGHHYYVKISGTNTNDFVSLTNWTNIYNNNIFIYNSDFSLFRWRINFSTNDIINVDCYLQLFDLTQMYGSGYEPNNIDDFNSLWTDPHYDYVSSKIVSIESDNILSIDYYINYTLMGKIKNLFVDFLDFSDSVVLNIFIAYTFLWLMMFVSWHFLYMLFDFIVHLVDKERRRE